MKRIFAAVGLWFLTSCGFVQDELYQTGGFVGAQADSLLPAITPRQKFDRYLLMTLVLGPTALETAVDEEEAAAVIRRMNSLYSSLAVLRRSIECPEGDPQVTSIEARGNVDPRGNQADPNEDRFLVVCDGLQDSPDANWDDFETGLARNGYSFESLEYEVQQDLFFVARAVATNLDLDTDVRKLMNLNGLTLAKLWTKVDQLLPMFRETAARFRGGIIMYADIAQASCDPVAGTECLRLRRLMGLRFRGIAAPSIASVNGAIPERDVRLMLDLSRRVFDAGYWRLSDPQYQAIIAQLDISCDVAFHRQTPDDADSSDKSRANCGAAQDAPYRASEARGRLIAAIRETADPQTAVEEALVEDGTNNVSELAPGTQKPTVIEERTDG